MKNFEDYTSGNYSDDGFELEITDLEPDNRISRVAASIGALRPHFSLHKDENDAGVEAARDDLELEITDLSEIPAAMGSHLSFGKRTWRTAVVGLTLLLVLVLVLNIMPSVQNTALNLFARPAPVPTYTSSEPVTIRRGDPSSAYPGFNVFTVDGTPSVWDSPPLVPEYATLGPLPQDCTPGPAPQNFDPNFSPGVGGSPLWVIGFAGPQPSLTRLTRAKQPQLGWYQKVLLVLEADYAGSVSLLGGNLLNGTPLWFGDSATQGSPRKTIITLHSESHIVTKHAAIGENWIAFPVYIYIPAAGCYYLIATWGEEHWIVFFAAGRPLGTQPS